MKGNPLWMGLMPLMPSQWLPSSSRKEPPYSTINGSSSTGPTFLVRVVALIQVEDTLVQYGTVQLPFLHSYSLTRLSLGACSLR